MRERAETRGFRSHHFILFQREPFFLFLFFAFTETGLTFSSSQKAPEYDADESLRIPSLGFRTRSWLNNVGLLLAVLIGKGSYVVCVMVSTILVVYAAVIRRGLVQARQQKSEGPSESLEEKKKKKNPNH